MKIARALGFAAAAALLAFLGSMQTHWHGNEQVAWNVSGPWFVMSWVLAAIAAITTVLSFLNPGIAWTSVTCGAIGICMVVITATKATVDDKSALYVPLIYATAQSLFMLVASLERLITRARTPARALLLVTAVLGGLGIGLAALWLHAPPPVPIGFVEEMHALDDGAILVWWLSGDDTSRSRGWVTRVDLTGRTVWRSPMPDQALVGDSIAVGSGIVAVRYTHRTAEAPFGVDQAAIAYSLVDGRPLWDRTLTTLDRTEDEHIEASLSIADNAMFVGNRLVEWAQARRTGDRELLLDAATGTIRSQLGWRQMSQTVVIGTHVLQHDFDKVVSLDVETGRATERPTQGTGCRVGDDYVTIDGDLRDHVSLVAFAGGDLSKRRVIREPFAAAPSGVYFRLLKCGVYRDRIVITLRRSHSDDLVSDTTILIVARTGEVLHELTLPDDAAINSDEVTSKYYDHSTLAGELPRFVPYLYDHRTGHDQYEFRLVMLDLENGAVVWQSLPYEKLVGSRLFHDGGQWYLALGAFHFDVTEFDGGSGRLTHAVIADAADGTLSLKPPYVMGGRVWTATDEHVRLNHAPVAAIDARTLETVFTAPKLRLRDITANRLRELGLQ